MGKIAGQSLLPTLERQKSYWDERWSKTKCPNEWAIRRGQTILLFLGSAVLKQPKILDIGCGTGWFTAELSKLGEATGIDLSKTAIELAKIKYPHVTFKAANLYEVNFQKISYDVVVAMEVLPHVENQSKFINLIWFLLKDNGYLALTMVNKFAMDHAEWSHGSDAHIINFLTMDGLKRLLQFKFRIIKNTTIIPIGNKGVFRFANSYKLNKLFQLMLSREAINTLKGRLGLGYTRVILAQKIS